MSENPGFLLVQPTAPELRRREGGPGQFEAAQFVAGCYAERVGGRTLPAELWFMKRQIDGAYAGHHRPRGVLLNLLLSAQHIMKGRAGMEGGIESVEMGQMCPV